MAKTPFQFWNAQSRQGASSHIFHLPLCGYRLGGSLLLSVVVLGAWLPANARPVMRVQGNVYAAPAQTITFPPVLPFNGSVYSPVQPIVQSGSGFGLSVQVGTPTYYPSGVYPSGYIYRQPRFPQQRGNVNHSVLINPTVINGSIRNSTLVNPTIVTPQYAPAPYYPATSYPSQSYPTLSYPTPSYPTPYYDVRTVIPTTRPEPQVVIDPQYGVRYQSPPSSSERQVVIDPQYGVRYSNPSGY